MMMSDDPWTGAKEQLNKFVTMDPRLGGELNRLNKQQAADNKLAFALQAGRVYGMRTRRCYALLKRELAKELRHPPVEHPW